MVFLMVFIPTDFCWFSPSIWGFPFELCSGKSVTTASVNYPGVRRLQEDNETWRCSGWIRELMVCEVQNQSVSDFVQIVMK